MIFLDTSAIYAWVDRNDPNHTAALERLQAVLNIGEELLTHNYVLLESLALVQARLGVSVAVTLARDSELFAIHWVDKELHDSGIRELQTSKKRLLSLVDHISFLVMTRRKITTAFAFDPDFKAAGFQLFEP